MTARYAIEWLSSRDGAAPMFLWAHYFDAHNWHKPGRSTVLHDAVPDANRSPDELFDALAHQHGWPESPASPAFDPLSWGQWKTDGELRTFWVNSREEAVEWVDRYDALIAAVDAQVGL